MVTLKVSVFLIIDGNILASRELSVRHIIMANTYSLDWGYI